ncbi:response regulator receiver domain-containing protein [Sphingomonas sp. BK036]|uniref:response regulator n=1 Tax=Sphingomonas sp. BK036 TaxID=2512122 RepID=UPI00102884FC|nr:response regulator [Sphingomonas sp. BK036]RZT46419.1 response regulator receiver domain-containing protein [Sphingomonas sp. BK036]
MTPDPHPPVLVVEDEMFIRMVAVDALEERGFAILEACDAREALDILERTPGIALIFTDINMPGKIDGLDLATEVAKRWPDIEIIVTSGGVRLEPADIPDSGKFLPKPYATEQLNALVREQLARKSPG